MIERIQKVFATTLGPQVVEQIDIDASMETVAAWDSLSFVQVMLAIEQEFGVKIHPDDAIEMTSVRGIVGLLERKQSA